MHHNQNIYCSRISYYDTLLFCTDLKSNLIFLQGQFSNKRTDKRRSLQWRLFRSKRCSKLDVYWVCYGICGCNSGLLDFVCQFCNSRYLSSLI